MISVRVVVYASVAYASFKRATLPSVMSSCRVIVAVVVQHSCCCWYETLKDVFEPRITVTVGERPRPSKCDFVVDGG